MGSEYSKEEQKQFNKIKSIIDPALQEKNGFNVFKKIKDKKVDCHEKFRALLLLKELMKTKNKQFIKYNAERFLNRQRLLAVSGKDCLKKYSNKNYNPQISSDFNYLNLECIQRWRQVYDKYDKEYVTQYDKLKTEQKQQLTPKFYNIPEDEHEVLITSQIENLNNNEQQKEILKGNLEQLQHIRLDFMNSLLQQQKDKIKNPEILQKFKHYTDEYKYTQKQLLDNKNQQILDNDQQLQSYITTEIFFYQEFEKKFNDLNDDDLENQKEFYQNLKDLNQNWLSTSINIDQQIDRINQKQQNFSVNIPDLDNQIQEQYDNKQDYKPQDIQNENNNNYEYPGDIYEPEKQNKFQSIDNEIIDQNKTLEQEVEELNRKKRDLQRNVQKLEQTYKENLTPQKRNLRNGIDRGDNDGLIQILRNKDQQIDDIQEKIKRLEKEHNKLNEPDLEFDLDGPKEHTTYKTPRKNRRSFRERKSNFKSNRSQSQLRNSRLHTKSIEKSLNRNAQNKKYEQSGTQFVNKMFNDIDKLINKNNHRLKRTNYQEVLQNYNIQNL